MPADLDGLVGIGEPTLDNDGVCEQAGADREVADRLWRALGFPDVPEGELAFTEQDARALSLATEGLEQLDGEERERALEFLLHEARIISANLANLAETQVEAIGAFTTYGLRTRQLTQAFDRGLENSDLGWLIMYALRRQLGAVLARRVPSDGGGPASQQVAVGQLLERFESLTFDVLAEAGGRVVKLIGDEAMLVCPEPPQAVRAALEILERAGDAELPPARAGIAAGNVLLHGGDYFGEPVNLASRIVDRAPAGEVIVDERVASAAKENFALARLPQTSLKDIGVVPLWRATVRS
jgi:adenylate cyclase